MSKITQEEITEAAKKYAYDQYYNLESSSDEVISIFIDAVKWSQEQSILTP